MKVEHVQQLQYQLPLQVGERALDCTKKACKASKMESTAVIQKTVLVVSSKCHQSFSKQEHQSFSKQEHHTKEPKLLGCKSKTGASPWPWGLGR